MEDYTHTYRGIPCLIVKTEMRSHPEFEWELRECHLVKIPIKIKGKIQMNRTVTRWVKATKVLKDEV